MCILDREGFAGKYATPGSPLHTTHNPTYWPIGWQPPPSRVQKTIRPWQVSYTSRCLSTLPSWWLPDWAYS